MASFPSSYIPTQAASATRAADVLTVSSPGVSYPLSLYARFSRAVATGANEDIVSIDDGDNSDSVRLFISSGLGARSIVTTGSAGQSDISVGAFSVGVSAKMACRAATNDAQTAKSGALGTQDTSVTLPATPTTIRFGANGAATTTPTAFGYFEAVAIFNSALSDANLQTVTT